MSYMPSFIRNLKRKLSDRIFDDGDDLFFACANQCEVYSQYGYKKSILWMLQHRDVPVYMVDTSEHWVAFFREKSEIEAHFRPCWVDVGEISHFGAPVNYDKQQNFIIYTNWVWEQNRKADLVLVGGRFRVCSFLTSLKYADPGAKLLFDDYHNRPHYHSVEDFIKPVESQGKQALFIVPDKEELDMELLNQRIAQYRLVTD